MSGSLPLDGQVVLVTGGAGTIGFDSCVQLAAAGARIVLNGRNQARCDQAVARARERVPNADIVAITANIADHAECIALVSKVEEAFGRLDHVVHCALSPQPGLQGLFEQTDPAQYLALMQQAVCAPMFLAHAALPALRRAGGGSIVAFPSDSGKVAAPNQTMVGPTRAAVMMFMRTLALEVSAYGIRCNCIAPTYVDTPSLRQMMASGPHGHRIAKATSRAKLGLPTSEEIAALVLFLCSPSAAHLTGQVISVNGGLSAA